MIIRMSANKGPFSIAIRALTWSDYSHVDVVLSQGKYLGAIPGDGVCIHTHEYPVEAFFEIDLDVDQELKVMNFLFAQVGKKYDYSGIAGFLTHRDWQEDDKWFCSEIIAAGVGQVKPMFNTEPRRISPRDVAINSLFKRIEYPKCN